MEGSYDSALERKKFFVNEGLTSWRSRIPTAGSGRNPMSSPCQLRGGLGYRPEIATPSKIQLGSSRAFAVFLGSHIVIALLAKLDNGSGLINRARRGLFWTFILRGSALVLIRTWRARGNPDELRTVTHGGQVGVLPPKWRRWVLGEDDGGR
jgi:hypothetical protein